MQSSTVMALRTLVMLVSLLAVPLAAVIGTGSWPRIQELIDHLRQKLAAELDPSRKQDAASSKDTVLAPTVPLAGPPIAPLTSAAPEPSAPIAPGPPTTAITNVSAPPPAALAPPVAEVLPLPPKPPFWPDTPAVAPAPNPATSPASPVASPKVDPQVQPAAYADDVTPPERAVPPADAPDRMGWIRHRLETLGAAYYRLETAGTGGEMFRFLCKITSPTNPNYVRYFEATSGEPLGAMQHVLDQIDAWMAKGESPQR